MADRAYEVKKHQQAKDVTLLKKFLTLEVMVIDDADTITVRGMTTIDNAKVVNLVDGTDMAVLVAGNIITMNDVAAVASHVAVMVVGV